MGSATIRVVMATGGLVLLATVSVALVLTTGLRAWHGGVLDQTPAVSPPVAAAAPKAPAIVTVTPPVDRHPGANESPSAAKPGSAAAPGTSSAAGGSAPAQPVVALPPLGQIVDQPILAPLTHARGAAKPAVHPAHAAKPGDLPDLVPEVQAPPVAGPQLPFVSPSGQPLLVALLSFLATGAVPHVVLAEPGAAPPTPTATAVAMKADISRPGQRSAAAKAHTGAEPHAKAHPKPEARPRAKAHPKPRANAAAERRAGPVAGKARRGHRAGHARSHGRGHGHGHGRGHGHGHGHGHGRGHGHGGREASED